MNRRASGQFVGSLDVALLASACVSESKTSNVLERSSGKNKEVIIAVPKTSNVLERLIVSVSTGAVQREKEHILTPQERIKK